MSKEQIAEQIAEQMFPEDWKVCGDFKIEQNVGRRKMAQEVALKALEHQEARVKELEEQSQADMKFQDELSERIKELEGLLRKIRDGVVEDIQQGHDVEYLAETYDGLSDEITEVLGDE